MRRRVTPPRYARRPFNAGKGGCLIYIVVGINALLSAIYFVK